MQLTTANILAVTGETVDETAAENIWIPAVACEIQTRCNRTFAGDDAYAPTTGKTNWVRGEIPQGVVDGVNTIFTLAQTPDPTKLYIHRDGQLVYQGVNADYTLTNRQIEFVLPPLPGSEVPLSADYLPLGSDDEEESDEPDYPPDLAVAACWQIVLRADYSPLSDVNNQYSNVKSETTGGLKVEYFEGGSTREKLNDEWAKILKRYRKPAICDSSLIPSASLGLD